MKRIKKIEILAKTYTIEYPKHLFDAYDNKLNGQLDYDTQIIQIRSGRHPESMEETLLHEILHGLWWAMKVKDTHVDEEHVVTNLASGLMTVIKQNKLAFTGEGIK